MNQIWNNKTQSFYVPGVVMIALTNQAVSDHLQTISEPQKFQERIAAKDRAWEAMGKYGHPILTGNIDKFKDKIYLEFTNTIMAKDGSIPSHKVWHWLRETFPMSSRKVTPYGNSITIEGDEMATFKTAFSYTS